MTAAQSHTNTHNKVQNEALRIITGAMRSTAITKMENITGVPPLKKRWEGKALKQYTKAKALEDHPMNSRVKEPSASRISRSSFLKESTKLQRSLDQQLPEVETLQQGTETPPWGDKKDIFSVFTTVPKLTIKEESTDMTKRALTLEMLDERYPQSAWIRAYTDGSATEAVRRGGAGIYIQHPNGHRQAEAIPTGLYCSNYKAETEALKQAARIIQTEENSQVVLLTDAKSVLEALAAGKLPQLQEEIQQIQGFRVVLQWIPAHCGIRGNEEADRLAKLGAGHEQETNSVSYDEMKTIIKSLFRTPQVQDSYHSLTRQEQVIIFRLRSGHNRLRSHMHRCYRIGPTALCPCGEADQTAEHILQSCRNYKLLRDKIWVTTTRLNDKLYGSAEELQKTCNFIFETKLQV